MHSSTVFFVAIFAVGFFHLLQASPIGHVGFMKSLEENATDLATTELAVTASTTSTSESESGATTDDRPRPILNETAVIDTLTTEISSSSNETHIRQKRSCGCGCCCCRPCCCCCCKPCCCCCCRPCCCCCRCCCCRCCCCQPCCCCCCRPCCCCGGCGCCGCGGGGRKKRSLQNLTHKLMDKQAVLLRQDSEASVVTNGFFFTSAITTSTAAPATPTTAIYTNAQIDAFGRSYANLAFADFTNNAAPTQYFYAPEEAFDQQQQQ